MSNNCITHSLLLIMDKIMPNNHIAHMLPLNVIKIMCNNRITHMSLLIHIISCLT
jgi:hypothetical protein